MLHNQVLFSSLSKGVSFRELLHLFLIFSYCENTLIRVIIDICEIFCTYILDSTDKYFSWHTHIDIYETITLDDSSIFFEICLECYYLILQIFIDITSIFGDGEILECKEYLSSIFEREMELVFISEISSTTELNIWPLFSKYCYNF